MNNYLNRTDIDSCLTLCLELEPIGNPEITILINNNSQYHSVLAEAMIIKKNLALLDPVTISIMLSNKQYTTEQETAIIIKRISVDNIDIIPHYDYLATYTNDHNNNNPTSYLGFNGQWTLAIDCPFYHWLHQVQGQGWLLT